MRILRLPVLTVCVLAWAGIGTTHAQVQPPQDRINRALDRARQVGIPVALLESKIAEGKAKGVSLERIAAALEKREAALERAAGALRGQRDSNASLSIGADAIESGVSEAALRAIAESAPRERRNVAIAVLTELVRQGHVADDALERVRLALSRGPEALANLPAEAARRGRPEAAGPPGAGGRAPESAPPAGVPGPGAAPQAGRPDVTPSRPNTPAGGRR